MLKNFKRILLVHGFVGFFCFLNWFFKAFLLNWFKNLKAQFGLFQKRAGVWTPGPRARYMPEQILNRSKEYSCYFCSHTYWKNTWHSCHYHYKIARLIVFTIRNKIPMQTVLLCLKNKTKPNKQSFHLH